MKAVISIANQKGGVGKTTTAINLSACLAHRGERVLLVDLDGQGNATSHLGVEIPDNEIMTSYALLAEYEPNIEQLVVPVAENLILIPGHIALAEVDIRLFSQLNRDTRLTRAFNLLKNTVDYIIVDCPPSLGMATVNALAASTDVLICVQTNVFAYQAIRRLLSIVALVKKELAPELTVHALATLHRPKVNLNKSILEKIRENFPDQTLEATISQTAALTEAAAACQTIIDYANGSRAHQDYEMLTDELTSIIRRRAEGLPLDAEVPDSEAPDSEATVQRVH
jgi:chromosome partitioning protein